MSELELKVLMDVLEIERKGTVINDKGIETDEYSKDGISISLNSEGNINVSGKIPLELAQRIYAKHPKSVLSGIRIGRDLESHSPNEFCTSARFEEFKEFVDKEIYPVYPYKYSDIIKAKRNQLIEDDLESMYIESYNMNKKIGPIIFFTEFEDFFKGKNLNNPNISIHADKQEELLAEVYRRLIEQGKPNITIDEWLNKHNMVDFGTSEAALEIYPNLRDLCDAINPFANPNIRDPKDFSDNVRWDIHVTSEDEMIMNAFNGHGDVGYNRISYDDDKILEYSISYKSAPEARESINYSVSTKKGSAVLRLSTSYNDGLNYDAGITVDLISGNVYHPFYGEAKQEPITPEQKERIIQGLKTATNVAKLITLKNMTDSKVPGIDGPKELLPQVGNGSDQR